MRHVYIVQSVFWNENPRHPWLKSIRLRIMKCSRSLARWILLRPCPAALASILFLFFLFWFFLLLLPFLPNSIRFLLRFSVFHFWHFNCCPVQRARSNATISIHLLYTYPIVFASIHPTRSKATVFIHFDVQRMRNTSRSISSSIVHYAPTEQNQS